MLDPIELRPTSKVKLIKTIRIPAGGRKQLVFRLTDENGRPVDLDHEPRNCPAPLPTFGAEPRAGTANTVIRMRAITQFGCQTPWLDVIGEVVKEEVGPSDPKCLAKTGQDDLNAPECKSLVSFELNHENSCRPGVYRCEIQRLVKPDYLIETWPVYFAIEPSLYDHQTMAQYPGVITIPEIRMAMSDLEQTEVDLLDSLEFDDSQILFAIRQPVDMWNETRPRVALYTTENFPYRYNWIQATVGNLLKMAAHKYRRNQLNYAAGGVTIDDQNKFNQYQQAADALLGEWRDWMRKEKLAQNISRGWRSGL